MAFRINAYFVFGGKTHDRDFARPDVLKRLTGRGTIRLQPGDERCGVCYEPLRPGARWSARLDGTEH
jgi:hypothetical protein